MASPVYEDNIEMENNEMVRSKALDDHVLPINFKSTVLAMLEVLKKGMQCMEHRVLLVVL